MIRQIAKQYGKQGYISTQLKKKDVPKSLLTVKWKTSSTWLIGQTQISSTGFRSILFYDYSEFISFG